jgi:hypothetical protein
VSPSAPIGACAALLLAASATMAAAATTIRVKDARVSVLVLHIGAAGE